MEAAGRQVFRNKEPEAVRDVRHDGRDDVRVRSVLAEEVLQVFRYSDCFRQDLPGELCRCFRHFWASHRLIWWKNPDFESLY